MKVEIFRRRGLRGVRWYWRVKARNGEIIATSEGYHNRADALATVELLRQQLPSAPLREVA